MAQITKHIGLSLGADICWPICYEEILKRLNLKVKEGKNTLTFDVERVTIEPFDLKQSCKYSIVLDRLTHWYHTSREWIKKAIILNDLYVLNNPWAVQSMEKQTTYCALMRLGFPIPETWLVPPKDYEPTPDLERTLKSYARLFDLGKVGDSLGYPMFMKPYDGGGWKGVSCINNEGELRTSYEQSGKLVMHLQAAVSPFDAFVRGIGLGPQVKLVNYDPSAPLHARYVSGEPTNLDDKDRRKLRTISLTINSFFGWDFNSCESLRKDGEWYPIDFANPCPDSQVTSLHWHFPWLIMANLRWSLFVAATGRKFRMNQNWDPYFEIAAQDLSYDEKLEAYGKLADAYYETDKFHEWCAKNLGHLEEVTWEFFGSEMAKDAVRQKVTALFPAHEIEQFTEYFWEKIQDWRKSIKS